MRILLSWLREYVDTGDDLDELADTLAMLGLPVEEVIQTGGVPGVVTARVVRTESHPDAAKVQRVWVDAGDGRERHVWCGAFNFTAGDVVPLATLGTDMPDGRTITRRGILGIDSEGMLCSARELGLGDDHTGILVLPADLPLGVPYGEALGRRDDVVLDIDVTRNRPDCQSYVGIARDLAAKRGVPFTPPAAAAPAATGDASVATTVEIVDGDRCGRFTSTVLSGVVVGPSAPWMAERLTAAGMRPINNVVDVSNYVMLETGQPNHAYDLATLGGHGFRIRRAVDGETLTTLDDVERRLSADDLLICDADDRPIGLAGIMGGADTEISEATTTVALEMAWFAPLPISQSGARLGLRSEASMRFERGVDPYGIDTAIARFVELLAETCPDLVVHAGAVDARSGSLPPADRSCAVRVSAVNRILGTSLTGDDLAPLLDPIGFTVTGGGDVRTVAIPSWRPDSAEEIDVIEEVARMYGYDRIGQVVAASTLHGRLSVPQQRRRQLRAVLLGLGITEAMPNPFLAPDTLTMAGLDGDALRIANPLVAEESVLRTSLRPGLLRAIAFNESHRRTGVALFEIGHVYPPGPGELPDEYEALGVVLAGQEAPAAVAVWREIAAAMGIGARIDQGRVPPGLHATRSATLVAGRDVIGAVGEVAPEVLSAFGITERVAVVELDLRHVLDREPKPARWKPTSRHPSSDLDLAFALPDDVPAEKLDKAIRQGAGAAARRPRPVRRVPRGGAGRRPAQPRLPSAPAGARPHADGRRRGRRAGQGHRGGRQARGRAARLMADPPRRGLPGWVWVVVPMTVSALLFGALAVAVRSDGDDGDGESIAGPAEEIPAVVGAADELLGTVPPPASIAEELGTRYGEVTVGFGELQDELDFAAEFDRLPDAEARLLGRTLGAIQAQLSPTDVGGARTGDDRQADILFALRLARSTIEAIDPDGTPREQALAILPFAVQDLTGFDEIAAMFADGDLDALAARIDGALSDAGAAELVSSVANAVSERLPATDDDLSSEFLDAYATASG